MARKRRSRKRKMHGPTYASVGSSRRKRRKGRRRINGGVYASVGKHKKRRRRMGLSGSDFMGSLGEFSMILLGGGVAKIGADIINPMLYGFTKGPIIPSILKGAAGAFLFHKSGRSNPLLMGASIGLAVSGLEDAGRALNLPWLPYLPLTANSAGTYSYSGLSGPAEDLFVVLPEDRQLNGPDDAPVISGGDAPVISGGDAPVISATDNLIIGGYNDSYEMNGESETLFQE